VSDFQKKVTQQDEQNLTQLKELLEKGKDDFHKRRDLQDRLMVHFDGAMKGQWDTAQLRDKMKEWYRVEDPWYMTEDQVHDAIWRLKHGDK